MTAHHEARPKPDTPHTVAARAWRTPGVVLAMMAVFAIQAWLFHDLRHDDAYITYRYGQNLAQGNGLVFNPGERILGTTAPGHALVAGTLYPIAGQDHLPSVMAALGCAGWTAQAVALFLLILPVAGHRGALFVATCVAVGAAGAPRWVALETTLVLACTLWTIVLALRDRWIAAGWLAALAAFLRPDAFLLPIMLAPLAVWRLRGTAWRPALALTIASAPWLLFATAYYGSPMPQTASAKLHSASLPEYGHHLLTLPARIGLDSAAPWATITLWTLAALGTWRLVKQDRRLVIVPAYAVAHGLAYLYLRPSLDHAWHLHPSVTILVALALVAVADVLARPPLPRPALVMLLATIVAAYALRTGQFAHDHETAHWFGGRDTAYHRAAAYLNEHAESGDLVTSFEVGTLGYLTQREMYDWSGLITTGPTFPSNRSNERWFVVDDGSLHVPTGAGYQRVATFRHGSFTAYIFDARHAPDS